ncbi:MAG: ABC transporter permease [Brevinematales bacterium]
MKKILYFAIKYLKFKSSERGLSAIAIIAFLTIVISSMASVVILSAANGIHNNFLKKIMAKDAHLVFIGSGKGISNYEDYVNKLKEVKGVISVEPYFEKQALIKGRLNVMGVNIMAFNPDIFHKDKDIKEQFHLESGEFNLYSNNSILLGYNLAYNLGATVGDYVDITIFSEDYLGLQYKFKVTGIFTAGHKDYDSSLAFISFKDAQEIFDSEGYAYGIALKVEKPYEIEKYLPEIKKACPLYFFTWKRLHRNDIAALEDEKMLIKIILFFFFMVVAFNILSTMIAMVLDKKEEIAILKAMGLKPSSTIQIFLLDGFFIGMAGGIFGSFMGLFLTVSLNDILKLIENFVNFNFNLAYSILKWTGKFNPLPKFEFFKSDVYYISSFPIKIEYGDIVFIMVLSLLLGLFAVIFPAMKAGKLKPVEVLRND